MEFKPIETQEEFNEKIAERLNRQKESILNEYKDYEEIKNENKNLNSQLQELKSTLENRAKNEEQYKKQIDELAGKVSDYELKSLKTSIALEKGIPYDLATRLEGNDEESIKKDAERLSELIGNRKPVLPLKNPEIPLGSDENSAYKKLLENIKIEE